MSCQFIPSRYNGSRRVKTRKPREPSGLFLLPCGTKGGGMRCKYQAKVSQSKTLRNSRGRGEGTASSLIHPQSNRNRPRRAQRQNRRPSRLHRLVRQVLHRAVHPPPPPKNMLAIKIYL